MSASQSTYLSSCSLLSNNVDKVDGIAQLMGVLEQQFLCKVKIERCPWSARPDSNGKGTGSDVEGEERSTLDVFVPLILVDSFCHDFPLLLVAVRVTGHHEAEATLRAQDSYDAIIPSHSVGRVVCENLFHRRIGRHVDSWRHERRLIEIEVVDSAKLRQDLLVFRRNCHGIMDIDRVGLEPGWKCSQKEFVEDATLVDVQVVLDLVVAPVGEISRMVVRRVETITSDQANRVGEHDSTDAI
jgi:hypothetical protein